MISRIPIFITVHFCLPLISFESICAALGLSHAYIQVNSRPEISNLDYIVYLVQGSFLYTVSLVSDRKRNPGFPHMCCAHCEPAL